MNVSVLFSGGKDSSLSAILLDQFFDVELVTCSFSVLPIGDIAKKAAEELGFPHRVLKLDNEILENAFNIIVKDGFPKNAIDHIHHKAVETLASDDGVVAIADGIRRDDRVPLLTNPQVHSIEDRYGVHYICPLRGYGRAAVNALVKQYLVIEEGQSDEIIKADYETELREVIRQRIGQDGIDKIFPSHVQSRVIGRVN
ncbi:MAG: asparagine synthase-related protein [Methanosarcinaceae archaeon]|nr:asparagine synthase-related protein [Methanosarcinaceae archaeon]MDF1534776.1 asparagine synthase-related protein [Methanosarcinaceae archaeon]